MTALKWDEATKRFYETGVSKGVLYIPTNGIYDQGYAWSGLTQVTESPSGAESTKTYADNIQYLNLLSAEIFNATIECYTYPDEFEQCDGIRSPSAGVSVGQQPRKTFGFSYQTIKGNDASGNEYGTKIHLVYGCLAAPSEKAFASVNDSPSTVAFSYAVSTTPVDVGTIGGVEYKPTSLIVVDSTRVEADAFQQLKDLLYGTVGSDPQLPKPADVIALFSGTVTAVFPTPPTYDNGTHTITIPTTTGVVYLINEVVQAAGAVVITADTIVKMIPDTGYVFIQPSDDTFFANYS